MSTYRIDSVFNGETSTSKIDDFSDVVEWLTDMSTVCDKVAVYRDFGRKCVLLFATHQGWDMEQLFDEEAELVFSYGQISS